MYRVVFCRGARVKSGKKLYKGWRMNTQVHPYENSENFVGTMPALSRPAKSVTIYF